MQKVYKMCEKQAQKIYIKYVRFLYHLYKNLAMHNFFKPKNLDMHHLYMVSLNYETGKF